MHRARLFGLLLGLVMMLWIVPALAAIAAPGAVLAQTETETAEEDVPLGPEPNLDNTFRPDSYTRDWTWGMGAVLAGVGVLAAVGTGLGYYVLVLRPQRDSEQV